MNNHNKITVYKSDVLKTIRCLELIEDYLSVTYVECEDQLQESMDFGKKICGMLEGFIYELIDNDKELYFQTEETIRDCLSTIASILVRVNMGIFEDFIIGFDIIDKYHRKDSFDED